MVAALQCHEAAAYNRFVIAYRRELQDSDAALKAFFVRRGGEHGEAGYDTFKTKAANLSALEQARDAGAFCADAHALFQAALANRGSLMSFVETRASGDRHRQYLRGIASRAACRAQRRRQAGDRCAGSRGGRVGSHRAGQGRRRTGQDGPVKVADVRPADAAVGGVPSYSRARHALSQRRAAPPPAMDRMPDRDSARDQDRGG